MTEESKRWRAWEITVSLDYHHGKHLGTQTKECLQNKIRTKSFEEEKRKDSDIPTVLIEVGDDRGVAITLIAGYDSEGGAAWKAKRWVSQALDECGITGYAMSTEPQIRPM